MRIPHDLNMLSDESLLLFMQSGNETAFAVFFHRYWKVLYEAAGKRLGNMPETQDIVQDIMEGIWKRRHELTAKNGSLEGYLFTLLKYRIIDVLAHTKRQEICYNAFSQLLALQENNILEGLISQELQAAIDGEIAAMPANMKKVVQLSRYHNHSVIEIAQRLSLSEQTVRNLLSQAIRRLKSCVDKYYNDNPGHAYSAFIITAATILGL